MDDLLTSHEAADWLSLPRKVIRKLVEREILQPAKREGQRVWFRVTDVANAARNLERKIDLTTTHQQALQALAIAQRTERKIDDLLTSLGGHHQPLSTEAEDMQDVYEGLRLILNLPTQDMTATQIRGWAKIFFNMTRGYFLLVDHLTGGKLSYRLALDAILKIVLEAPQDVARQDPDKAAALALLLAAQQSLKQEAYFYLRDQYGARAAERAFPDPERQDVNTTILSLL